MIQYKDKIFPEYFIDPITAVITNSKGEIQKTSIHKDGYAYFKSMAIHKIQAHTHYGYKKYYAIHHIDKNKLNNSLSNLVYLTCSEHNIIHKKGKILSEETKRKLSEALKGKILSEETKRKLSEALKGKNNPMYGKQLSEETKRKMSEAQKGNKNMLGKHHSQESKRKISESLKGKILSEETKRKMSESLKGNKNMLGKHHTEETKRKLSEVMKNISEETKRKMSESLKGKIWINNGVISKRVQFNEDIPEGFSRGRLKK